MRILPVISALAATVVVGGIAAGPASADSIVYAKQGNLYLTSPDGSKGYQLTFDGGWSSPSQADDGTIGALHNKQLVRMNRSGQLLNAPIDGLGSPGHAGGAAIGGPYEPRISPDGTRFAYYFYVQTSTNNLENNTIELNTGSYTTWTYADHFTDPGSESEYLLSDTQPEWLTNDRLLVRQSYATNMWTWKLGTGNGYTYPSAQFWFGLQDPPDEWGVAAYHYYSDPGVSRDGSKLAMTDGGGDESRLYLARDNGPLWTGEPPYPELDYTNPQSDLAAPSLACETDTGEYLNPSWSSDGSRLAYGTSDGVHVFTVPANLDCSQVTDSLVAPDGYDPAFGPADVDPSQAPKPPSGAASGSASGGNGTAPSGSAPAPPQGTAATGVTMGKLSLKPRSFRAGRGAKRGTSVRFTLSANARVTFTVQTKRGKPVKGAVSVNGKAGANTVRFNGRVGGHTLRRGTYRLTASATPADGGNAASASADFSVRR